MNNTISVTVELPASEAERIAIAYCTRRGYGPTDIVDAVQYVKAGILKDLYQQTLEHEASLAASAARDAVFGNPHDPLTGFNQPSGSTGVTGSTGPTGTTGPVSSTGPSGAGPTAGTGPSSATSYAGV